MAAGAAGWLVGRLVFLPPAEAAREKSDEFATKKTISSAFNAWAGRVIVCRQTNS